MSIRIGFIGQRGIPPSFGGIERYVDEIVRRLPANEVKSYAYCRRHYVEPTVLDYATQLFVPSLTATGLEAFGHSFLSSLDSLRRGFDLVHFQALGPSLFSCLPRMRGTKIVATVHGLDWDRAKWGGIARMALKSGDWMMGHAADAIISVSKNLQRYYEQKYGIETFHIPIGFSEARIIPINRIHDKFGLEPGKFILFLNRIVPEKGAHYAIEAFKQIRRDDLKLVIAGASADRDPYLNELRNQAHDDSRIIFTGYVSREEVHELYSNAYLFVLPSELEGMPAVLLEAMSHRCPVLVSDIQENLDVISKGGECFGFTHPNKDVQQLENQMRSLLDDPDQVCRMRETGHAFVHQEYSWEKSAEMTYEVYKHVLNS